VGRNSPARGHANLLFSPNKTFFFDVNATAELTATSSFFRNTFFCKLNFAHITYDVKLRTFSPGRLTICNLLYKQLTGLENKVC